MSGDTDYEIGRLREIIEEQRELILMLNQKIEEYKRLFEDYCMNALTEAKEIKNELE